MRCIITFHFQWTIRNTFSLSHSFEWVTNKYCNDLNRFQLPNSYISIQTIMKPIQEWCFSAILVEPTRFSLVRTQNVWAYSFRAANGRVWLAMCKKVWLVHVKSFILISRFVLRYIGGNHITPLSWLYLDWMLLPIPAYTWAEAKMLHWKWLRAKHRTQTWKNKKKQQNVRAAAHLQFVWNFLSNLFTNGNWISVSDKYHCEIRFMRLKSNYGLLH